LLKGSNNVGPNGGAERSTEEHLKMKLKVHVAADQLTQWWDGYICGKSEKMRRIIQSTRYYLAMSFLKSEGFLVLKDVLGDDVATWELPTTAPSRWRELDQFRHIERDEISISDEAVKNIPRRHDRRLDPQELQKMLARD
jgi:hypothetical protein